MRHPQFQKSIALPPSFKRFVLLFAASKGGTGKSTLAVNVAVTAHHRGLKTIIFDTDIDGDDGQRSCQYWSEARDPKVVGPLVRRASLARIGEAVAWAEQKGFKLIIIDTAGRDAMGMKRAVDLADFMLTPSQPSPLDIKAMNPIRRLWDVSKTPGSIVLNLIVRENLPRTQYYLERYAEQGAVLPAVVGRRVQYIDAMESGLGVSEYLPGGVGDREMRNLLTAIFQEAEKRRVAR